MAGDGEPPKDLAKHGGDLAEKLKAMLIRNGLAEEASTSQRKTSYAFWGTQPVAQFDEPSSSQALDGPIDAPKTVEDIRKEPYNLPDNFRWIYQLLSLHYVEDDDNMFRFAYSPEFLRWALRPPSFRAEWHIGVRVSSTGKLVAFISGIPACVRVGGARLSCVEINFLCVHKKLRSKRLAPVLIREVTRRVNLANIWQAVYTAGVLLPKPVAECQYWHRSLNPKKLISIGFSRLAPRMTMARTLKLYKLPEMPATPGVRPMEARDEEVAHWLVHRPDVVFAYVVEARGGGITDLLSFYTLPSTVIGHDQYDNLKAAYMFYTELKFGVGDGKLRYYLFNWRVAQELRPGEVGLVML
eukprot:scaffold20.g7814.t1